MIVEQNSKIKLYAHFLNQDGSEATITGTPTVSIYHIGSAVETDISNANMTQVAGTLYYYEYYVSANADKTDYTAKYSATYSDGTVAKGAESFKVVRDGYFERAVSGGLVQKTVVKSGWSEEEKSKLIGIVEEIKNNNNEIKELIISLENFDKEIIKETAKEIDRLNTNLTEQMNDNKNSSNETLNNKANEYITHVNTLSENMSSKMVNLSEKMASLAEKMPSKDIEILKKDIEDIKSINTKITYSGEALNKISESVCNLTYKLHEFDDAFNQLAKIIIKEAETDVLEKDLDENK